MKLLPLAIVEQRAEQIARHAHRGQREHSTGDPMIRHVERVVALVSSPQERIVAWLHDVVEDNSAEWPLDRLREREIPVELVAAVELLTRRFDQSYAHYIANIASANDDVALAVKIADLQDHLRDQSGERLLPDWPARMASLRPRYEQALTRLLVERDARTLRRA